MLNFHVLTLFPEIIYGGLNHSILKRAISKNIISINCVNIRDFSMDKNKRVDDYPYGGGYGMLMKAQPVYDAYKSIKKDCRVIYLTPQGKIFNQKIAYELAKENDIIFLCGHYEGIDQRVIDEIVTDEISVGDYILTGGEIPAMILIDSVSRLIPNVLGKNESYKYDSFENNLLEYPQYTRPEIFNGCCVPKILLSGNHNEIKKWRRCQSFIQTFIRRPDLFEDQQLESLLRSEMSVPSAMNYQNCGFVIVRAKNHLLELSTLNPFYQILNRSELAIFVCGKILSNEYWVQNCLSAYKNILTQANKIGLEVICLEITPYEDKMKIISDNLNLPEHIKPLCVISIGIPDNFAQEKIHYEKF